jgi:hypothetical protein
MADFVAILKKTIESQGVNTPELRARIYSRARQTIEQKLDALVPAPTPEQKARQLKSLDEAVTTVEASFAAPVFSATPKPADPLEDFISEAEAANKPSVPKMPEAQSFSVSPVPAPPPANTWTRTTPTIAVAPPALKPSALQPKPGPLAGSVLPSAEQRQRTGGIVWALAGAVLAAGIGYAAYTQRDAIMAYYNNLTAPAAQPEVKKVATTTVKPADPAQTAAEPAAPQAPVATPVKAAPGEEKFTQRLTEDGKEVDAGPATAAADVGEGASVAQVTTPPGAALATPGAPAAADPAAPAQAAAPAAPETVAVGQKAVFYEEKTGTQDGTVDQGAVVWSVVQDSPGTDQPQEPAIRAEVDIPEKSVKLRLTIKRNGDKTLPASHIIEMAFSVPEGFQGGSIDGVQRVTFKDTEQAPGNPLVGVPANFGDGFFLIALTDEKSAIEANLALMARQSWIDIPLTYKSGRRALISIEKGIPGDKVFQEVLKAWQGKASG